MNEELRERLAKALYEATWEDADWNAAAQVEHEWHRQSVSGLLNEIEAAGKVIVDRDRFERVLVAARWLSDLPGDAAIIAGKYIEPGDLDPLP